MTVNQLKLLKSIIVSKRDDIGVATEEEVEYILDCIDTDLHRASVVEFKEFLDDELRAYDAGEGNCDKFYSKNWLIMFGDVGITVPNTASLYNAIEDWLQEYIESEL